MTPSPSVFFAAVAQRTSRLRFGPLVYCLPLYEPLRLIEEICMLDHMSGGRFDVGVGKGISPFEVGYFNIDHAEALAMYIEAFDVIRQGLTQPVLDHQGKYYSYSGVPMELAPVQKPHPPFWYGLVNPETIPWAAENAINVVSYPPPDVMAGLVSAYEQEWARVGSGKPMPATALGRHPHRRYSRSRAQGGERSVEGLVGRLAVSLDKAWHHQRRAPGRYDEMIEAGRVIVGTLDHVRDEVVRQITTSGANYFIGRFAFGNLTTEQSANTARLFAEHIIPAVRQAALTRAA